MSRWLENGIRAREPTPQCESGDTQKLGCFRNCVSRKVAHVLALIADWLVADHGFSISIKATKCFGVRHLVILQSNEWYATASGILVLAMPSSIVVQKHPPDWIA